MTRRTRKLLPFILCGGLLLPGLLTQVAAQVPADPNRQSGPNSPTDPAFSASTPIISLDRLTVVASKVAKKLRNVSGSVTVLERADLDFQMTNDLSDLVRYQPALSVATDRTRFGNSGLTIRGIGGNRVTIELDGVPMPDGFRTGSFSNAGRDWVSTSVLEQVEILRGPSSALYGSDAIGGVLAFRSRDPWTLVAAGESDYIGGGVGYQSRDERGWGEATYARTQGDWSFLAHAGYAQGHENDLRADDPDARANPQDFDRNNILGKWVHEGAGVTTRVLADYDRESVQTDVQSGLGERDLSDFVGFPLVVDTTLLLGDDRQTRSRISVELDTAEDLWGSQGIWRFYYLDHQTRQDTVEERTSTTFGMSTPSRRERRFELDRETIGAEVFWNKQWQSGDWQQDLVFGSEIELGETSELRNGQETNLLTGEVSNVVAGEAFPVRDFPVTDTLAVALFAQDEIRQPDGDWTLIPALRAEFYKVKPEPDDIFADDNPDTDPVDYSDFSLAPKLGVIRDLGADSQIYAQYAHGFRSAPLEDVNFGLALTTLNIIALPNPDLRPESSDGIELGYRYASAGMSLNLTGFYTRYDDFIESRVNQGFDPATGSLIFQSVNREQATIYGIEMNAVWALSEWYEPLEDWTLRGALAWARGDDDERDQPLSSVDPSQAIVALRHDSPDGRWGLELLATLVARKDRLDSSGDPLFEAPGYGLLDLIGDYQLGPQAHLHWGVFNLTDKRYWRWSNVRGRPANDPQLPILSEAGINARVALRVDW